MTEQTADNIIGFTFAALFFFFFMNVLMNASRDDCYGWAGVIPILIFDFFYILIYSIGVLVVVCS